MIGSLHFTQLRLLHLKKIMFLKSVVLIRFVLIITCFCLISCSTIDNGNRSTFYNMNCKVPRSTASSKTNDFKLFLCAVLPDKLIEPKYIAKSYKEFFDEMVTNISNSLNYSMAVQVTNVTKFYDIPCNSVYDRFMNCFEDYCSRPAEYNSMVLYGPWCSLQMHEHEMDFLEEIFYNLPDDADVAIMTTSPQFMPIAGDGHIVDVTKHPGLKDLTKPSTLMFLSGTIPRFGIAIWNMLNYFRYRHAVWITIGREKASLVRYCFRLSDELQLRASVNRPRIYVNYFVWYDDVDKPSDWYLEMWLTVKNITRIILLCANDEDSANFVDTMVRDMNAKDEYGLFVMTRNVDTLDLYLQRLRSGNSIKALQFLKILSPKQVTCPEYDDDCLLDDIVRYANIPLAEKDRLATMNTFVSNTFCAILHYYRKIADVVGTDKRLASVFAETFRSNASTMLSRNGRAIQWLPVFELYSAAKESESMDAVLEINWNTSNNATRPYIKQLGPIFWYGSEEPLLDALYVCSDNTTRFFPCPKVVVVEISKTKVIVVIVCSLVAMAMLSLGVFFIGRYYIHNNQRYLISHWWIPIKQVQFSIKQVKKLNEIEAKAGSVITV